MEKIDRSGLVYTDRVTIVTGGNKGMGEGIAAVFADAGAKVMICGRDADAGAKVERELNERGPGECFFKTCDVSQPDQVRAVIDATIDRHGQLDCLINNAGYHPPQSAIDQFTVEDLE